MLVICSVWLIHAFAWTEFLAAREKCRSGRSQQGVTSGRGTDGIADPSLLPPQACPGVGLAGMWCVDSLVALDTQTPVALSDIPTQALGPS